MCENNSIITKKKAQSILDFTGNTGYEIVDSRDFFNREEKIKIKHTINFDSHIVESTVNDILEGNFVCPDCYPELTHTYGISKIKEKLKLYKIKPEKENFLFNIDGTDIQIDFKIKNCYIKYLDCCGYLDYTKFNEQLEKLFSHFVVNQKDRLLLINNKELTTLKDADLLAAISC